MWSSQTHENVTFSWHNGVLISILYNNGEWRTTFDTTNPSKFYMTTVQCGKTFYEYYHVAGTKVGGLYSVFDDDMSVTGCEIRKMNPGLSQSEYLRRKKKYTTMIKMQLTTDIPDSVLEIYHKVVTIKK